MVKKKVVKKKTGTSVMAKLRAKVNKIAKQQKSMARVIRVDKYQTPKSRVSVKADRQRKAKAPGRRISKTGRKYTEHRQNRSDKKGTEL